MIQIPDKDDIKKKTNLFIKEILGEKVIDKIIDKFDKWKI